MIPTCHLHFLCSGYVTGQSPVVPESAGRIPTAVNYRGAERAGREYTKDKSGTSRSAEDNLLL